MHLSRIPSQRNHALFKYFNCLISKRLKKTCFNADGLALGAVEIIGTSAQLVKIDLGADVHLARVNLHDARPGLLRRRRELDLAVEAAGPEGKSCELSSYISDPRSYFIEK